MRKKTEQSVDVAAVTAAWQAVFEESTPKVISDYTSEGWMTVSMVADQMKSSHSAACCYLDRMARKGVLEKIKVKADIGECCRTVSLYRPKL